MLHHIRNTPNLAGTVLASLAFCATVLIAPMFENITSEGRWGLSAAIAAFAFYKGRLAVQRRLEEDAENRDN